MNIIKIHVCMNDILKSYENCILKKNRVFHINSSEKVHRSINTLEGFTPSQASSWRHSEDLVFLQNSLHTKQLRPQVRVALRSTTLKFAEMAHT